MENYTFELLGLKNVHSIIKPYSPKNTSRYSTIGIKEPLENVKRFLINSLVDYVRDQKNGKCTGFIAGVAYLMDGSAIMVYTGSGESRAKLFSVHLTEEDCNGAGNVAEYITGYFEQKAPEGLLLIQEIEAVMSGEYHFRIIHENTEDRENNIIKFPQEK